jgi:peptidoglycan-associated lipoprotein
MLSVVILTTFGGLESCRRKVDTAPAPEGAAGATAQSRRADSLAAQRRADSLAALQAAAARDAAATDVQRTQAELANVLTQRVYFDYDKDNLRDDATAALDAKAAILLANPSIRLIVTGHTDERGTAEYNLALGQRRAAQVKRYLASKGIAGDRLTTQSLGDSQPAVQGSDEAAYQQNRRAEFEVRNAPGVLVRPRP